MLPIVKLVRQRVAASGLPLRRLAAERGVSYSTLRVYNDPKLAPLKTGLRPDTLRHLALGLDLPLSEVQRAADASVERLYSREIAPDATALMASIGHLSQQEQDETVAELLKLLQEQRAEGAGS